MINKKFINKCLELLKSSDVKNEIKIILSPLTDLIIYEIYPYIYMIIFLVFLIFVFIFIILIILLLLLKNGWKK
jgi:hypothetical protein